MFFIKNFAVSDIIVTFASSLSLAETEGNSLLGRSGQTHI